MAPEKSHEKIKSQYERHERQQNQGPIRIAVCFWRGLATRKEDAKDTIAPQMVHGSSSGGSHSVLAIARGFSLEDNGKERRLSFATDDIEYAKRYQEADWQFTTDDARIKLKHLYPIF
jgi:hypothetical protein